MGVPEALAGDEGIVGGGENPGLAEGRYEMAQRRRIENEVVIEHPSGGVGRGGEDDLLPLFVAAGAAGEDVGARIFSDQVGLGRVSAFRFG